ncbi:MAG: TIM barrel protein [Planctomycetes bacterium]|nr:TIM barrel protein [Planctomycetota bacterium]
MNEPHENARLIYQLSRVSGESTSETWASIRNLGFSYVSLRCPTSLENENDSLQFIVNEVRCVAAHHLRASQALVNLNGPFSPLDRPRVHLKRQIQCIIGLIDAAAESGIQNLTIAAGPGTGERTASSFADDRHTYLLELCHGVRYAAEMRGVRLAILAGRDGFLNSPAEARDFVDAGNSPWVGLCLPVPEIDTLALPAQWLRTLGRRVFSLSINLGSLDSDYDLIRVTSLVRPDCLIALTCDDVNKNPAPSMLAALFDAIGV